MNMKAMRRLQVRVTLGLAVMAAVVIGLFASTLLRAGGQRVDREAEHAAEERISGITADLLGGLDLSKVSDDDRPADIWFVNPDERQVEALGKTNVEPPVVSLAERAIGGSPVFERFTQGGDSFLAHARALSAQRAVVTAIDLEPFDHERAEARQGVVLWSLGGWLAIAGAGALLVHLALRPARRARAEQVEFLADAAHELRTPLAVIQASASQALSRSRSSEEYVQSLSEIRSAAERAGSGVSQLLDLARLEAGQAVPRTAPLRLDLLVEEVVASTWADGCEVQVETGPSVIVHADMPLLRQAIENVLVNAVRRAETVRIVTRVDGRDGVVEVSDDGPGFEPAALGHIFDRYRRGDERGGAGLGLAIVRSILAAHGGEIDAANRPEGGAVFQLRVPLASGV